MNSERFCIASRRALYRHTLVDPELLLADLALARARGYAMSNSEHVEGVVSVAAPIFDHTGKAIGAIGLFGPSSRNPIDVCMALAVI